MKSVFRVSHVAYLGIIALLLTMVACGAAAPADPSAPQGDPVDTSGAAAPTANPTPMPESPAAAVVNPGKLTWMIAGWGNETSGSLTTTV
jgi:hypothetical protein